MGKFDSALKYNKKALNISLRIYGSENHPHVATTYWNIGFTLEGKKEYKNSLKNYNKALKTFKLDSGGNNYDVVALYINIGNLYLHKKDFIQGLKYYQKALLIAENIFEKNNPEIARINISIGNLYLEKEMHEKAMIYFKKGLEVLQNSEKQNPLNLQALNQIGKICNKQKDFKQAVFHYNQAIFANSKNDNSKIEFKNIKPNDYYNSIFLLKTLQGKAETLQSLYLENNRISDLDQSIVVYKKADTLINYIRQSFHNYQDKITFAKQAKEIYTDAIQAQLLLHTNKHDQESLEQALYYAEKSKANTLKELLTDTNAKNFTGIPGALLEMEKVLKTDKAFYQSRISKEQSNKNRDTSKIVAYENKLFNLSRKQDSISQVLEKNYPKYYQLKYQNDIVSVSDIQQQLEDKTTVLEFFTADNTTYAFTISKNSIAVKELATPKLTEQVEVFRKSILTKSTADFKQKAHDLYNQLLAPVADKLVGDNLIIVPDGSLWHLNFELLLTQKDESNNPALLPYLLRDYAVTYANSANLLFGTLKSDQESKTLQECLAFSFSDSTQKAETRTIDLATLRDAGEDLPGTRKEIRAIANIIDGQYYFGSQAIEANFKKNASKYNILHLALHGDVDNERPENSKLYFTKSKDTLEDNLLYSHELFALDIPAELTVLSACNTGTGKIAKGEGIMSLGTAFQYAGTKSLLLTSWEVSDQTTPELMQYFYTNLKAGMNKAKALQQAKLQYLTTANINRTAPFYWGGFYLVGDAAPMHFKEHTLWYWILGLGVLGILFLVVFWTKWRGRRL